VLKQTLKGAAKTLLHPLRCLLDTFVYSFCVHDYPWEVQMEGREFWTAERTRQKCIDYLTERVNQLDPMELAIGYPAVYLVRNGLRIHRLTADETAQILKRRNNE